MKPDDSAQLEATGVVYRFLLKANELVRLRQELMSHIESIAPDRMVSVTKVGEETESELRRLVAQIRELEETFMQHAEDLGKMLFATDSPVEAYVIKILLPDLDRLHELESHPAQEQRLIGSD